MRSGLVIADSGAIFSLAIIRKLELLDELFNEIKIPKAVWDEITLDQTASFYRELSLFFEPKVAHIGGFNDLAMIMDYGESESLILYKELNADFLLIDDKKARNVAENFNIKCIGTIGILASAKNKGLIKELRPLFKTFLENDRYYSISLLNFVLEKHDEHKLV